MNSSVAARTLIRSRSCLLRSIRDHHLQRKARVLSTAADARKTDSPRDVFAGALALVIAGGALTTLSNTPDESACDMKAKIALPSSLVAAQAEPRRSVSLQQPRNVMLHRMRSGAGRTLTDRYKVDWKTVLGEGAYGSVHPARLAATGEKVSNWHI